METPSILIYGYPPAEVEAVRAALAPALPPFRLLSAAGRKADTVDAILASGGSPDFEASPVKVLLLAGFPEEAVHACLAAFPSKQGIARPLFCVKTETNGPWTFESLVKHLYAERAEFAALAAKRKAPEAS